MERWKPIIGFEDYEVSDQGRIKSFKWGRERLLSSFPQRSGYLWVNLCKDGVQYKRSVARLVLTAFVGPPGPSDEACHGPGGNQDNRLSNLRWGTAKSNTADKYKHGTMPLGSKVHNSKLTELEVAISRVLHYREPHASCSFLARAFGVTRQTMASALKGETWSHVA